LVAVTLAWLVWMPLYSVLAWCLVLDGGGRRALRQGLLRRLGRKPGPGVLGHT
jgi:hypothetical protein